MYKIFSFLIFIFMYSVAFGYEYYDPTESLTCPSGSGTPYFVTGNDIYVDNTLGAGCAGGAGTSYRVTERDCAGSDGTKAYNTLVSMELASKTAGDRIIVRGGVYYERFTIDGYEGNATNRFTYCAYDGEDVIIDGGIADELGAWTPYEGGTDSCPGDCYQSSISTAPFSLMIDDDVETYRPVLVGEGEGLADLNAEGEWYHSGTVLYVCVPAADVLIALTGSLSSLSEGNYSLSYGRSSVLNYVDRSGSAAVAPANEPAFGEMGLYLTTDTVFLFSGLMSGTAATMRYELNNVTIVKTVDVSSDNLIDYIGTSGQVRNIQIWFTPLSAKQESMLGG